MMKVLLASIGLAACAASASAQNPGDGNALLHNCSLVVRMADSEHVVGSALDNLNAGACMGLVHGVMDVMTLWQSVDHGGPVDQRAMHGCIPDSVKTLQAARIVVKYLNDRPALLNGHDSPLVLNAMVDAFPCR